MKFGLSTRLFQDERLARHHLEAIAARGFSLVDIADGPAHFDPGDDGAIDEAAGWLADLGLEAAGVSAPVGDPARAVEMAGRLRASTLTIRLGDRGTGAADLNVAAVRRELEALADATAAARVPVAIELPAAPSLPLPLAVDLFGELDTGSIGACLDLGRAHLAGGVAEAIEELSGHIVLVRAHDNRGRADDGLLPFQGSIDWPAALMELWKVGYAGPLILAASGRGDWAPVIDRAVGVRTRLQAILDELSGPWGMSEFQ